MMLITAKGIIIRTGLEELREIGRNTQGVRLIKLDEDDKVVAVARLIPDEDDKAQDAEDTKTTEPGAGGEPKKSAEQEQ
jgi:DNA gyrase subunit A